MITDEIKALQLRRAQLQAELSRIDELLATVQPAPRPSSDGFRDVTGGYRNSDSNGNYNG